MYLRPGVEWSPVTASEGALICFGILCLIPSTLAFMPCIQPKSVKVGLTCLRFGLHR